MHELPPRSPPDTDRCLGYEVADAPPRGVLLGFVALGTTVMLALALAAGILRLLESSAARRDSPASLLTIDQTPPRPRLQSHPARELSELRADENRRLSTYGWVDEQERIVRIPIEQAIDLLSERGIPEPTGPAQTPPDEEGTP